jgi:transcriptional regulator with XRE-family HTH domain
MARDSLDLLRPVAARIERLRVERRMTVEALADESLLEAEEVEAVLRGQDRLSLSTLIRIADSLGVDAAELLEGISWMPDREPEGRFDFRLVR